MAGKRTGSIRASQEGQSQRTRLQVLSLLLANEAKERADVQEFRRTSLKGGLLLEKDVARWIGKQSKRDGAPTLWTKMAIPSNRQVQVDRRTRHVSIEPPIQLSSIKGPISTKLLFYYQHGDSGDQHIATTDGGVLDGLRHLSETLARIYGWREAQATHVVLTGHSPEVAPCRMTETSQPGGRIKLELHPGLTPREVAAIYRDILRNRLSGKRHRTVSDKHYRLAEFVATRRNTESWRARMAVWNQSAPPEERYEHERNFHRDCVQAKKRILAPTLLWDERGESVASANGLDAVAKGSDKERQRTRKSARIPNAGTRTLQRGRKAPRRT